MFIPHKKYLQALFLSGKTAEQVYNQTAMLCPYLSLEELDDFYDGFLKKYDNYITDTGFPAQELLDLLDVSELYSHLMGSKNPEIAKAIQLASDPLMFRVVTSIALLHMTDREIDILVNSSFNYDYSHDAILFFIKYIFNVKDQSLAQKQKFVDLVKDDQLRQIYKVALKGNKDYLFWELGVRQEIPLETMLKDVVRDSYFMFQEQAKKDPKTAQRWGSLIARLGEKIDKMDQAKNKGNDDMLENLQFKIKRMKDKNEKEIKHLSDLDNA